MTAQLRSKRQFPLFCISDCRVRSYPDVPRSPVLRGLDFLGEFPRRCTVGARLGMTHVYEV